MAGQEPDRCRSHEERLREVELETSSSIARLGQAIDGMHSHVEAMSRSLEQWADKFGKMQSLESDIRTLCINVKGLTDVLESERRERAQLIASLEADVGVVRRTTDRLDLQLEAGMKEVHKEFTRIEGDINSLGTKVRSKWEAHDIACLDRWGVHDDRIGQDHDTWANRWWGLCEKLFVFLIIGGLSWGATMWAQQGLKQHLLEELKARAVEQQRQAPPALAAPQK